MTALGKLVQYGADIKSNSEALEDVIKTAAQEYYTGIASLEDYQFDDLIDLLRECKPESELLHSIGWGYEIPKIDKRRVEHHYDLRIGSLDKIHSLEEVKLNCNLVISPKLDGLSVVLYFEKGKLTQAITRGDKDGTEGIDVTEKLWTIIHTPGKRFSVSPYFTGAIRGEIIVTNSDWELVKDQYPEVKNQRNYAAGVINRHELSSDLKYLSVVMYNILVSETFIYSRQNEVIRLLNDCADIKIPIEYCKPSDLTEGLIKKTHAAYKEIFPIDGLVMTDDLILNEDIGNDTMKFYLNQIAYKFEAERKDCYVNGIEWNMSRTGNLIPVVKIDTVELSGTSVSRATGFNARFIKDNRIGTGAIINIMKSGEIIPDIQEVIKGVDPDLPTKCPICNEDLVWDGVNLRCGNLNCSSRKYFDLQTFICTIGATENIGWSTMEKFLDELEIDSVDKLLARGYVPIDDKGQKQRQLFNEVLKKIFTQYIDATDALCALNIPKLGRVSASKLASNKDLLDRILNELLGEPGYICTTASELSNTVGRAVSESIINNSNKLLILDTFWNALIFSTPEDTSEMIEVCITGKLSVKRAVFEEELKQYGFISSGIGKKTKYLITDNPNGISSKNKKATELGIEKITEADFREKFMK